MAFSTVSDLIDDILARVRQRSGAVVITEVDRAIARRFLSHAIHSVNLQSLRLIAQADLTTVIGQGFYKLSDEIADVGRVVEVIEGGVRVTEALFQQLVHTPNLLQTRSDLAISYSLIGRDLIFIWPVPRAVRTIQVRYAKLVTTPLAEVDVLELDDEDIPGVMRLVETLLLLRQRDYPALQAMQS